jgi:hypothetical protein
MSFSFWHLGPFLGAQSLIGDGSVRVRQVRSVTFVLQAQKNHLPNFETWYQPHQETMKEDKKMRWLVESRNFIEKQGDLATRSRFLVTLSNSWSDEPTREFALGPEVPAADVAKIIANSIPNAKINEAALLRFERQWIDSQFPDAEVLTTLVHCYANLQDLLLSAHSIVLPPKPDCSFEDDASATNELLPASMLQGQFPRIVWFKLQKGKLAEYETLSKTITREESEQSAQEHYPTLSTAFSGLKSAKTFREQCVAWFQGAKIFLERDGFHTPMALIGTERIPLMYQLRPADRADQHAMVRDLASRCARANAVWCVFISEAWTALASSPFKYAANDPRRGEVLVLHGIHADGSVVECRAVFTRTGKKIALQPEVVSEGVFPPLMQPIVAVIQKR